MRAIAISIPDPLGRSATLSSNVRLILIGDQQNRFDLKMDETQENKGVFASITPAELPKRMENPT